MRLLLAEDEEAAASGKDTGLLFGNALQDVLLFTEQLVGSDQLRLTAYLHLIIAFSVKRLTDRDDTLEV